MNNKEAYIQFIETHPLFTSALKHVDENQAERIKVIMRGFAEQVASAFIPVMERVQNDPEFAELMRERLTRYVAGGVEDSEEEQ